jgi:Protein kinase domain
MYQDHCFYVMEFVDGETVEAHVSRRGPLPPAEALRLALQVARALAATAKKQLVHRDLKPANLMLVDQEGEPVVKVIDFGLAKGVAGQSDESSRPTVGGGFIGTPYYAPRTGGGERGGHPLGPLLAGRHAPFSADGPAALLGLGGPGHEPALVQARADGGAGREAPPRASPAPSGRRGRNGGVGHGPANGQRYPTTGARPGGGQ